MRTQTRYSATELKELLEKMQSDNLSEEAMQSSILSFLKSRGMYGSTPNKVSLRDCVPSIGLGLLKMSFEKHGHFRKVQEQKEHYKESLYLQEQDDIGH